MILYRTFGEFKKKLSSMFKSKSKYKEGMWALHILSCEKIKYG